MNERKRLIVSAIVIMVCVAFAVAGITISILYNTAFEQQRERLVETARSQARLIEAVARFDAKHSQDAHPDGAVAATMAQITEAHSNYEGFGATGEFVLGKREGDMIVFLLSHRHFDLDDPHPVAWDAAVAEPMRRALLGSV